MTQAFRFDVPECARLIASAVGLEPDDKLVLWRLACDNTCPADEPKMFIEFRPTDCEVVITASQNPLLVDVPGMYELRFEGAFNPDVRVCYQKYERNCRNA